MEYLQYVRSFETSIETWNLQSYDEQDIAGFRATGKGDTS